MIELNIVEEIKRRQNVLQNVMGDKSFAIREAELCRRSIIHFVNNWCFTYDPRLDGLKRIPFNLWDYQEEALLWFDERLKKKEVGLVEKTRDMGVTWLATVWALHKFVFEEGFAALFASRVETNVDDKTLDSIFGKIRFNLYHLPLFLRPPMHQRLKDGNDSDRYLVIVNPKNGNEITGSSTNSNLGRGGRKSVVFLDEFAFVEHSEQIWTAVRDVSDCLIPISTPNGKGNQFAKLRFSGTVPILSLHWKRHPHKDNDWYEMRKKDSEPWQIAQELDIDYQASKSGRVYKKFNLGHHVAPAVIYPNPAFEHFVTWDFGIADSMTMIFGQVDVLGDVEIYACYDNTDHDIEFYLPLTKGSRPANNEWLLMDDAEKSGVLKLIDKVWYDPDTKERQFLDFSHYGDFAGTQRTANSKRSVRDRMRQDPYNINLLCTPKQSFPYRIQCLDSLLKMRQDKSGKLTSRFRISPDCQPVIDAFLNYVWDSEDVNAPNIKPKHDWSSHFMSSLEFLAINRFPVLESKPSDVVRVR